jgi:hypothetical protein
MGTMPSDGLVITGNPGRSPGYPVAWTFFGVRSYGGFRTVVCRCEGIVVRLVRPIHDRQRKHVIFRDPLQRRFSFRVVCNRFVTFKFVCDSGARNANSYTAIHMCKHCWRDPATRIRSQAPGESRVMADSGQLLRPGAGAVP